MLGSQPKTDFFVTTNAAGHNIAENNSGDDSIETLEKKKWRRKEINLQHATKAAFRCCRLGHVSDREIPGMKVAKILGNTQHRQLAQNTKNATRK